MMMAVQRSRSEGASDLAVRRRLSWRAPTANGDKLLSFKLMLTNMDGRARVGRTGGRPGFPVAFQFAHMQAGEHTALDLPPATDHLLPAVHPPPAAAACTACPLQEAYEGPDAGCEVTGLAPGSQYIFCVKALYDDASFLWSEPLMVTTTTTAAAAIKGAKKGSK
jgi:hypothetical protein